MNSFANDKLKSFRLANGLAGLLADCERRHGEEIALKRAEPAVLETLRHQSIVTSSEASCAIEGILLEPGRLEALFEAGDAPRNRDEWEVENYRRALEFIYTAAPEELQVTPELVRRLHGFVKAGEADAGEYKTKDNVILEVSGGRQRVRFRPLEHRKFGCMAMQSSVTRYKASMKSRFFDNLQIALASERLDAYRQNGASPLITLARYLWNIALCESLYSPLQMAEIALRNALQQGLSIRFKTEEWYDDRNCWSMIS